ncbi:hypothetical protein EDB19DRAFT_858185 [Suillus lakei]|nr:hypothetical protein EDB19DRAFT_858185 [Suillus lakei]
MPVLRMQIPLSTVFVISEPSLCEDNLTATADDKKVNGYRSISGIVHMWYLSIQYLHTWWYISYVSPLDVAAKLFEMWNVTLPAGSPFPSNSSPTAVRVC